MLKAHLISTCCVFNKWLASPLLQQTKATEDKKNKEGFYPVLREDTIWHICYLIPGGKVGKEQKVKLQPEKEAVPFTLGT